MFSILLVLQGVPAWAATPLQKAEKAFQQLEFDVAERWYREALKGPGSRQERLESWRGLGLARAFMGDTKGARDCFEKLLLLDPQATVDASLGPKITRPFQLARKSVGEKDNSVVIRREDDGAVVASVQEDVPWAKSLVLSAREEGGPWKKASVEAQKEAKLPMDPKRSVEAWAVARDDKEGELYLAGSGTQPVQLVPTQVPEAPAVAAAVDEARAHDFTPRDQAELSTSSEHPKWPYIVGAAVAVAAAATVGVVLAQPQPVKLPPADRTSRLP